jgi:hypothetical protein
MRRGGQSPGAVELGEKLRLHQLELLMSCLRNATRQEKEIKQSSECENKRGVSVTCVCEKEGGGEEGLNRQNKRNREWAAFSARTPHALDLPGSGMCTKTYIYTWYLFR